MNKLRYSLLAIMAIAMMTICPAKMFAATVVATVTTSAGDQGYSSLEEAFEAAKKASSIATIKLLTDYELTIPEYAFHITVDKGDIRFDLNNHELKTSRNSCTLLVAGGHLSITDNSTNKGGKVTIETGYALEYQSGSLDIAAGTFSGSNAGLYINREDMPKDSVSLAGGTFVKGNNDYSIYVSSYYNWSKINMDGYCFFDGKDAVRTVFFTPAIYSTVSVVPFTSDKAYASVTEGKETKYFLSMFDAIHYAETSTSTPTVTLLKDDSYRDVIDTLKTGSYTIDLNGKTIDASNSSNGIVVDGATVTLNGNGTIKANINALKYLSGKLTVNGGTYESSALLYIAKSDLKDGDVTLHGGTFVMKEKGDEAINVGLKGYTANWSLLGMEGYCFADANNNVVIPRSTNPELTKTVTVRKATDADYFASVTIGETTKKYIAWHDVLYAAKAGTATAPSTIKLLKDINYDIDPFFNGGVTTLDLNGCTIESNTVYINRYTDLTIKDSKTGGTMKNEMGNLLYPNNSAKLTILSGNFIAKGRALDIESDSVTIYGGNFISTSTNINDAAVYNGYSKSPLAGGYSFFSGDDELENRYGTIKDKKGNPAKNVTVKAGSIMTFDEKAEDFDYPIDCEKTYKSIIVKRTMKADKWNTLCLPFDMTAEEVTENFGEDVKLKYVKDFEDYGYYFVNFEDTTAIKACTMYVVMPSSESKVVNQYNNSIDIVVSDKMITNNAFSFQGKTATLFLNKVVMQTFFDEELTSIQDISKPYYAAILSPFNTLKAASVGQSNDDTNAFILNDNKFYMIDSDVDVRGFRWLIITLPNAKYSKFASNLDLDDDTPTILRPQAAQDNDDAPVYNLAGQRVNNSAKGIVIKGGKKILR